MTERPGTLRRASAVTRTKWFLPVVVGAIVVGAFADLALFGNDAGEVTRRLEEKYGVEEVVWQGNGRYQRDTLVVDGKDVTEDCVVAGDWGPLDDLAIECDGEVAFVPVDR